MSYILEALKKSEQERRQGPVPDLQTVHLAGPQAPVQRVWPYAVIVLLLVSLAFVLGWMQPWRVPLPGEQASQLPPTLPPPARALAAERAPASVPVPSPTAASSPVTQPVEQPVALAESRAVVTTTGAAPSLEIQSVPHLSDMPPLVQQAIPDMSFAGHVYSPNAAQRSVIINGRAMAEGDTVIRDLRIEQITSDGIVFNYKGQLFRMAILQDWSFDY